MAGLSKKDLESAVHAAQTHAEMATAKYGELKRQSDILVATLVQKLGGKVEITQADMEGIKELKLGKKLIGEDKTTLELIILTEEEVEALIAANEAAPTEEPTTPS